MDKQGPAVPEGDAADQRVPFPDPEEVRRPRRNAYGIRPALPRLADLRDLSRRAGAGRENRLLCRREPTGGRRFQGKGPILTGFMRQSLCKYSFK